MHRRMYIWLTLLVCTMTVMAQQENYPLAQGNSAYEAASGACIDYLDLGPSRAHAGVTYIGQHPKNNQSHSQLRWQLGIRSDNPDDFENLHSIRTDTSEVDPIVGNKLRTIPQGETASVRLGALYENGSNARVEYKYQVVPGQDLLDFKYAVVLEDGGHKQALNPFVQLEILDGNGQVLESTCTQFEFVAGYDKTQSWQHATLPVPHRDGKHESATIYWQDWDSITVSLYPYVGQTLTIRITASRCVFDTHVTYCYYTLGCRSGALEGIACGDTSTDLFTAPAGFNYRWYRANDPAKQLIQTTQPATLPYAEGNLLHISPSDTAVYMVDLINLGDSTCFTSLPLNPNPRYPKAVIRLLPKEADCTNYYEFLNRSYVEIITRNTTGRRDTTMSVEDVVEDVVWDWGDGSPLEHNNTAAAGHNFPETGGTFLVQATATMTGGQCAHTTSYSLTVPDLTVTSETFRKTICRTDRGYYLFRGEAFDHDTLLYVPDTMSTYGCPIAGYLDLHFADRVEYHVDSTICEGDFVEKWGKRFLTAGLDSVFSPIADENGCDSVYFLNLTVHPVLDFQVAQQYTLCPEADIELPFHVAHGDYTDILITPDAAAVAHGFQAEYRVTKGETPDEVLHIDVPGSDGGKADYLHPGHYTFLVEPHSLYPDCPAGAFPVTFEVRYSSSVIVQRGNYLMLYNADHNGGYDNWTAYQWYKNGHPIPGETSSQLLVLNKSAHVEYSCLITDSEGLSAFTCPFSFRSPDYVPVDNLPLAISVSPTILSPGEPIHISQGGCISLYDALGRKVLTQESDPSLPVSLPAPSRAGVYVLVVGNSVSRILVR